MNSPICVENWLADTIFWKKNFRKSENQKFENSKIFGKRISFLKILLFRFKLLLIFCSRNYVAILNRASHLLHTLPSKLFTLILWAQNWASVMDVRYTSRVVCLRLEFICSCSSSRHRCMPALQSRLVWRVGCSGSPFGVLGYRSKGLLVEKFLVSGSCLWDVRATPLDSAEDPTVLSRKRKELRMRYAKISFMQIRMLIVT